MSLKLTKKEIEKKFYHNIKDTAKKYNWKFNQFFVYKTDEVFLYDCSIFLNTKTNLMKGLLSFKFKDIDDIFWELHEMAFKKKPSLSQRANSWTKVEPLKFYVFEDLTNNENNIIELFMTLNNKVEEIAERFTNTETYLNYINNNYGEPFVLGRGYSYLTNLLYLKQYSKIIECKENNFECGIKFGNGENYYDRIFKYLQNNNFS